jgi:hypothetical protein
VGLLNMPSPLNLPVQVNVTGFSEADQANVYNMAHDKSGKGRQGLGIASRPKKVCMPSILHPCWVECHQYVKLLFLQALCKGTEESTRCCAVLIYMQGLDGASVPMFTIWVDVAEPVQVAGARWQGTKKRLDSSDDEGEGEASHREGDGRDADDVSENCSEDTQVFSDQEQGGSNVPEAAGTSGRDASMELDLVSGSEQKRLRKHVLRCLKSAPFEGVRMKKLEKRVLDGMGIPRGTAQRKKQRRALRMLLGTSSRFVLSAGIVHWQKGAQ